MLKTIDKFLGAIAKYILIAFLIYILYMLTYKIVIGQYMMYEDYYENRINKK
jgi:hypothetical protein